MSNITPTDLDAPLPILFEDEHYVAIYKPARLLIHRSQIDRHETRFALQMLRDQIGQRVYPIHRLDKPTAGVVIFGKSGEAARDLSLRFEAREVEKHYLALVRGWTDVDGVIDYPLKEQLDKMTDKKARQDKDAQEAVTHYQNLQQVELPYPVKPHSSARYSLLSVSPKTGRKHQIRRHMKHIFHPIVGDTTHGDNNHNKLYREQFNAWRLMLVAHELGFVHPYTDEQMTLKAELDEEFLGVLGAIDVSLSSRP